MNSRVYQGLNDARTWVARPCARGTGLCARSAAHKSPLTGRESRSRVAPIPRCSIRTGGLVEKAEGFQEHPDIRPEEKMETPKERLGGRQLQQAGGRVEATRHDPWVLPGRG